MEEVAEAAKSKSKRKKALKKAALVAAKQQLDHKDDPPAAAPQDAWQGGNDTHAAFGLRLRVVSGKGRDCLLSDEAWRAASNGRQPSCHARMEVTRTGAGKMPGRCRD